MFIFLPVFNHAASLDPAAIWRPAFRKVGWSLRSTVPAGSGCRWAAEGLRLGSRVPAALRCSALRVPRSGGTPAAALLEFGLGAGSPMVPVRSRACVLQHRLGLITWVGFPCVVFWKPTRLGERVRWVALATQQWRDRSIDFQPPPTKEGSVLSWGGHSCY